jgi:hypothetical protein
MSGTSTNPDKPGPAKDMMKDAGKGIDGPRLTPQGRTDPDVAGEDETSPQGGVKQGQTDKAEG